MWGIIPAAGTGSRIQPLAFSKELLPVGSRTEDGVERPRAVSEHLVERMLCAGATKICFVISPGKSDILGYYGGRIGGADIAYAVQSRPAGLCDAIFRALPLIEPGESVLIGLPDTIWFPTDGFTALPDDQLSFLLFPVPNPEVFDVVLTDRQGNVSAIQVKPDAPLSNWIWGAIKLPGAVLHALHALWREPGRGDEYFGTLVNEYLARGGEARGIYAGEAYVDVGTLNGYRHALRVLADRDEAERSLLPVAGAAGPGRNYDQAPDPGPTGPATVKAAQSEQVVDWGSSVAGAAGPGRNYNQAPDPGPTGPATALTSQL